MRRIGVVVCVAWVGVGCGGERTTITADAAAVPVVDARPAGAPAAMVASATFDFGTADIGQLLQQRFTVTNVGTGPGSVRATFSGAPAFVPQLHCVPATIKPGESCQTVVDYLPYATGPHTGTVTFGFHQHDEVPTATIAMRGDTYTRLELSVSGHGSITGPGIACTFGNCEPTRFVDVIVLGQEPEPGHRFVAWSDVTCGTSPTCPISPEPIGRAITAYFAPTSDVMLSVEHAGTSSGEIVVMEARVGGGLIAVCRGTCQVPLPRDAPISVRANGPSRPPVLSGACTSNPCTFNATASRSITATFPVDPKESWTRLLETGAVVATEFAPDGSIVLLTRAYESAATQLIKLDASGRTLWARPNTLDNEVRVGPDGTIHLAGAGDFDPNGYLLRVLGYQVSDVGAELHFADQLTVAPDGLQAIVGQVDGMLAIDAARYDPSTNPPSYPGWKRTASRPSRQAIASTGTTVYALIADGPSTSLVAYAVADGSTRPGIAPFSAHANVAFTPATNGDFLAASSSTTEVRLRRSNALGATVFQRDIPRSVSREPYVSVRELSGERAVWIYSDPESTGYTLEVVDATGLVTWTNVGNNYQQEIYAMAATPARVAIAGAFKTWSTNTIPEHGLFFGMGYVQLFEP